MEKKSNMFKIEKKILNFIEQNITILFLAVITILAVLVRYFCLPGISGDMEQYLIPWFETLKENGGIAALSMELGDYNVPYLTILAVLTYLPFQPVTLIKGVSVLFDFALAVAACMLTSQCMEKNGKGTKKALVYTIVLFSPLVILNSAYWGQCDSIFGTFLLLTLLFLIKEKYPFAFIFMGCAFAFKLQAVFLLPLLVLWYVSSKKFSILNFLWIPGVNGVLCLPAILAGRPVKNVLMIYFQQTSTYEVMTLNYPNLYYIMAAPYEIFQKVGIMLALVILGTGCFYAIKRKMELSLKNMIYFAIFSIWTCLMFLPSMHERYGYVMEILLILYGIFYKEKRVMAFLVNMISLSCYTIYLFTYTPFDVRILSAVNLICYGIFCIQGYRSLENEDITV